MLNVEGNFLPNIDYPACFARGIEVLGIGPVFGQPVAEMALGLALAAARDIPRGDAELRAGTEALFDEGVNGGSFLLAGKTVGLVGCGSLGRALLPLLRPFGCRVLAHDPWLADEALEALGVEPAGLVEVFARSRVVFVLAPPTTENAGAIGRDCFEAMAAGSVVVLVSRAAVVDWPALLDAAESGHIRAAIDVFPEEPIPAGERARSTPGTILSAHRAGNVPEIWRRSARWSPTTSRRSSPAGRRSGCNEPIPQRWSACARGRSAEIGGGRGRRPRPARLYFFAAGFLAAGFFAAGFFAAGLAAGFFAAGLGGAAATATVVSTIFGAGGELLHRGDAVQRRALRLVCLARGDDLAVGREETEAELAGRAFLDDELSGHGCLSLRG